MGMNKTIPIGLAAMLAVSLITAYRNEYKLRDKVKELEKELFIATVNLGSAKKKIELKHLYSVIAQRILEQGGATNVQFIEHSNYIEGSFLGVNSNVFNFRYP
jgi:hypothetical protein